MMSARNTESTNVRLTSDLKGRVIQIAEANEMSLSDVVRLTLITYLPEMEQGEFRLHSPGKRARAQ